jgi:hypothetical protein
MAQTPRGSTSIPMAAFRPLTGGVKTVSGAAMDHPGTQVGSPFADRTCGGWSEGRSNGTYAAGRASKPLSHEDGRTF